MSENILRVSDISMQFGAVLAIDNLSLEINKGEIVALIGPNGAGKTTAFNCITGVYSPVNGQVDFMGTPIVRNYPQRRMAKDYIGQNAEKYRNEQVLAPTPDLITYAGMARTFQNIRLWGSQTVFDNVLTAKHLRRTSNLFTSTFRLNAKEEARMRDEVMELLCDQGLEHLKDEISSSLPYGIQRRLEIARALATEPKLLLLDEPAAGMNPQETQALTDFINEIREKYDISIFLIEHHMDLVMNISDRIYVLDFGKMIAHGTPQEIQNNKRVIDAYLGVADDA